MKVKITTETRVTLPAGTVVEVSEAEGHKLTAFGVATEVKPKAKPKKKEA